MRNQSACLVVLVLLLGCGCAAIPVAGPAADARPHDAPAPATLAPPPALVAAPPPLVSVDGGLPGFDGVRLGAPLPALKYRDFQAYADGLVDRHCTGHFASIEGLPLADVDIFEGCCGDGVLRLHAYVDTAAPGSQEALMTRLAARFGAGEVYAWDGREARRVAHPAFELRIVPYPEQRRVKLMFTAPGAGDDFDAL